MDYHTYHETFCAKAPPIKGPVTDPMAHMAPKYPNQAMLYVSNTIQIVVLRLTSSYRQRYHVRHKDLTKRHDGSATDTLDRTTDQHHSEIL